MKGRRLRELFGHKATKAGAVLLAAVLVLGGSVWVHDQSTVAPELTKFVDTFEEEGETVSIDAEETPLAKTKVTKKTTTKTKTKKVKLKTKAKKTYTKKTPAKKSTKTKKTSTSKATTTVKTVKTVSMTSKFKKGSKINTQVTTTKTTVTTTVVQKASATKASAVSTTTAAAAAQTSNGEISITNAAPTLAGNVTDAFNTLNFKVTINSGVSYSGLFDARTQSITLRALNDTVYHEVGHFVAFVAGNVDTSSAFKQIFEQEKSKYTAYNKAYVCANSSEYFAESFKNYTLDPAELKASRPLTYEAIEKAVQSITTSQVAKVKAIYSSIWT